jgi:hypothetical protein
MDISKLTVIDLKNLLRSHNIKPLSGKRDDLILRLQESKILPPTSVIYEKLDISPKLLYPERSTIHHFSNPRYDELSGPEKIQAEKEMRSTRKKIMGRLDSKKIVQYVRPKELKKIKPITFDKIAIPASRQIILDEPEIKYLNDDTQEKIKKEIKQDTQEKIKKEIKQIYKDYKEAQKKAFDDPLSVLSSQDKKKVSELVSKIKYPDVKQLVSQIQPRGPGPEIEEEPEDSYWMINPEYRKFMNKIQSYSITELDKQLALYGYIKNKNKNYTKQGLIKALSIYSPQKLIPKEPEPIWWEEEIVHSKPTITKRPSKMMDEPVEEEELYNENLDYEPASKKHYSPEHRKASSTEKHWIRTMKSLDDTLAKEKTHKSKMKYLDALWHLYVTTNPKIPGLEKTLLKAITKVERGQG